MTGIVNDSFNRVYNDNNIKQVEKSPISTDNKNTIDSNSNSKITYSSDKIESSIGKNGRIPSESVFNENQNNYKNINRSPERNTLYSDSKHIHTDPFNGGGHNNSPYLPIYPIDSPYIRPNYPNIPINNRPLCWDDPFDRKDFSYITRPSQMRNEYNNALMSGDGYRLVQLAKIENQQNFMPEIRTGDILYNAYRIGLDNKDPNLLLNIAKFENINNAMTGLKASDVLEDSLSIAKERKDAKTLLNIAKYENLTNISYIGAGDILKEAYNTALEKRDVNTLYEIASYEGINNIIPELEIEDIIKQADKIKYGK